MKDIDLQEIAQLNNSENIIKGTYLQMDLYNTLMIELLLLNKGIKIYILKGKSK